MYGTAVKKKTNLVPKSKRLAPWLLRTTNVQAASDLHNKWKPTKFLFPISKIETGSRWAWHFGFIFFSGGGGDTCNDVIRIWCWLRATDTAVPEIDAVVLLAAMPMCNKTVTCTPNTEINNRAAVGWGAGGGPLRHAEGAAEVQWGAQQEICPGLDVTFWWSFVNVSTTRPKWRHFVYKIRWEWEVGEGTMYVRTAFGAVLPTFLRWSTAQVPDCLKVLVRLQTLLIPSYIEHPVPSLCGTL